MFHRGLRRMRRDERGQALVIGAVAMLVLAVAVLTSVSIGHGVYSKIKLQDAADAQSYTIAVKEARAYNFLAYTNRAMVVHYNCMLTVMSYLSHAYYLKTTIGNIAKVLSYVPYIGPIFQAIKQIIDAWMKIVDILAQVLVPLLTVLNVAMWLAQEAVMVATALDLAVGSDSVAVKSTDPKARSGYAMSLSDASGISGAISNIVGINLNNVQNFLHPVDDGISSSGASMSDPFGISVRSRLLGSNKLSDQKMAKYRLLMGNIVNSSRREWTAQGKDMLLIGRRWSLNFCAIVGSVKISKTADSEIKSFDENFSNNVKDQLYAEDAIGIRLKVGCGFLSKTVFEFDFRMQVAADRRDGWHSYALHLKPGGDKTLNKGDKHHNWLGITPFYTGDPSYYNPWNYHFGYPCNMVITTKDMIGQKKVFELKANYLKGEGQMDNNGVLDMTWGGVLGDNSDSTNGGLGVLLDGFRKRTGGMMATSVGRAIYHRPGEWKEEPNFFNPLWTARLAPIKTHWQKPTDSALYPELMLTDLAMGGVNY